MGVAMAGLVLKLAPHERILINGVVMENGERKATLRIKTPDASILRLRDALHPDDVNSPVKLAYYTAQMRVAGETDPETALTELAPQIEALVHVFEDTEHASVVGGAVDQLRRRNFYGVMRALQPLIAVEEKLLEASASADPKPENV